MRRVQWFPLQKRQKHSSSPRSLEEPSLASCSVMSAIMEPTSSPPKSMRRASSPPPVTPHASPESPLRRTASSPSFCFLPCSLSELLPHESPQSTPTPPRRCETEANIAGIKNSDDTRHSFSWKLAPRWNSTPFLIAVAALVTFVFVLVVIGTVLGTYNSDPKMDGFELLPDLFENEPSVSVVREKVVRITAPTTARAETTAPVVAKRSATAAQSTRSAKVRKATNTFHRQSIPTEDARGTTYAVRKLPTTAGRRRTSTPSPTMGHRKGVQVVGSQDPTQRKYHLDEVTGDNKVPSRIVYEFDENTISEQTGDYAAFRPKKRKHRSPSTTPAGDFVEEIV